MGAAHEVERELDVSGGDGHTIGPAGGRIDVVVDGIVGVIDGVAIGEAGVNAARNVGVRVEEHGLNEVEQVGADAAGGIGSDGA